MRSDHVTYRDRIYNKNIGYFVLVFLISFHSVYAFQRSGWTSVFSPASYYALLDYPVT